MLVAEPLSRRGLIHGYSRKLAAYFNIDVKNLTRKGIDMMYEHYKPVIEFKLKHGWVKDHVRADIEAFDFLESCMRFPSNQTPQFAGWKDEKDPNNIMLRKLVLMHACIRDDDSFYDMCELVMEQWKHEHWDRYERSAAQAYQLIAFPILYGDLIKRLEHANDPLPQLEDLEKEYGTEQIDYVKMEKKIKHGMERKRKR